MMRKKYANEKPVNILVSNQKRTYMEYAFHLNIIYLLKAAEMVILNGNVIHCLGDSSFNFLLCLKESDQTRTSLATQIRKLLKETLSVLQDEGQIFRKKRTQDEVYNVCAHTHTPLSKYDIITERERAAVVNVTSGDS